jgi:hypothetical protein
MTKMVPVNKESPLEKAVKTESVVGLLPTDTTNPINHPTDAEPKMRWDPESGKGYIDVGGGSVTPGGYSIGVNIPGRNPVEFYKTC